MAYTLQHACEPFAVVDDITCDCEGLLDDEIEEVINQATDALVAMTGFRYRGVCTETFRPRGPAVGLCGCDSAYYCGCSPLRGFTLPSPVAQTSGGDWDVNVMIDGSPFTDWVLVDGNFLVRTDGRSWPGCQDLGLADDAVGAFTVEVTHGEPVDLLARNAVVEISCLFLKKNPNSQRGLPAQTRSVSAQGVTITMETLEAEMKHRAYLLPWTIRFLTTHAPRGAYTDAFIYSPELDDGWRLHQT